MEAMAKNAATKKKLRKKYLILAILLLLSGLGIFITFILMDFSSIGISKIQKLTGYKLIDMYLFYSGEQLYAYLSNFNDEALKTLLLVHGIDYVFMTSVLVFEVTILVFISEDNYKALFITSFAFLEFLFDLSENVLVDIVVRKLPDKVSMLAGMCGGMTTCKWIFTFLYGILSCIVLVRFLMKISKNSKIKNVALDQNNGVEENTESEQDCEAEENIELEQVAENNEDVGE